jgi:hypothetical protein
MPHFVILSVRTSSRITDWINISVDFDSKGNAEAHWRDYYYQVRPVIQGWMNERMPGKMIYSDLEHSVLPADTGNKKLVLADQLTAPKYNEENSYRKIVLCY